MERELGTQEAPSAAPRPRRRRVAARRLFLPLALVLAVPLLSSCSETDSNEFKRMAYPLAASDRAKPIFDLWEGAWIAAGIVFVLVFGLIVWSVVRYRRRSPDDVPTQVRYNLPIEVLYTIAPIIVVSVLFFHTVRTQDVVQKPVADPDHQVLVIGQQWSWTFDYLDDKALDGSTDVYDVGTPDDLPELWLPVNETVTFTLRSNDVVHSFWIPEFYFKRDVFPGTPENTFSLTPNRTGVFRGRCAELCGVYHSRMLFDVHVVTAAEYAAHLNQLEQLGQVGTPRDTDYVNTVDGLEDQDGASE